MRGQTVNRDLFDVSKAVAAIGYLVEKTGATMYSLMKMMYLADKMHLERYGRFIAGDNYVAMKQGPVPSCTYNMIKHVRGENCGRGFDLAAQYLAYGENFAVSLKRKPEYEDELSASDIECLEEIANIYNKVGHWAVRDMSHDDAWKSVWSRWTFSKSVPIGVEAIAAQFEGKDPLISHLRDSTPGEAVLPSERTIPQHKIA